VTTAASGIVIVALHGWGLEAAHFRQGRYGCSKFEFLAPKFPQNGALGISRPKFCFFFRKKISDRLKFKGEGQLPTLRRRLERLLGQEAANVPQSRYGCSEFQVFSSKFPQNGAFSASNFVSLKEICRQAIEFKGIEGNAPCPPPPLVTTLRRNQRLVCLGELPESSLRHERESPPRGIIGSWSDEMSLRTLHDTSMQQRTELTVPLHGAQIESTRYDTIRYDR